MCMIWEIKMMIRMMEFAKGNRCVCVCFTSTQSNICSSLARSSSRRRSSCLCNSSVVRLGLVATESAEEQSDNVNCSFWKEENGRRLYNHTHFETEYIFVNLKENLGFYKNIKAIYLYVIRK